MPKTIAIITQGMSGRDQQQLESWLKGVGADLSTIAIEYVVQSSKPSAEEVKRGVERVTEWLLQGPHADTLTTVIAIGRFAVMIDTDLWRGGIGRCHGRSGNLWDGTLHAIAMYHPAFVTSQTDRRVRMERENSAKLVLSRALHLTDDVRLPDVKVVDGPMHIRAGVIGFDVETTQDKELLRRLSKTAKVDPRASQVKMIGTSDGDISFSQIPPTFDPDAEPVLYNTPFDSIMAQNWQTKWHDPKMIAHLLGEKDTEMKSLTLRWLGRPLMHYTEAGGTTDEPAYCVADATAHLGLLEEGLRRADAAGVRWLYENVERPMLRLYSRWSMEGVFRLDRERAERVQAVQTAEMLELAAQVKRITGIENPRSPDQIAKHYYRWPGKASGLPQPSTSEKDLALLRALPGINEILKYRELHKAKSTYVDTWLGWPFPLIGTLWRPCGAWTGRPSSTACNLQNISIGCTQGHDNWDDLWRCQDCHAFNLRKLLLPPEGKVFLSPDCGQLEVRVAAHLSQDANMIRLLNGQLPGYEDGDIHQWATDQLGVKSRTFGKIGVFSALYGGTEDAITIQAAKYGMTREEIKPHAATISRALPKMFPDYFSWANKVGRMGKVPGLFGRLHVPPPSGNENHLRRERINAPIQGGGVDIVKLMTLALEAAGFHTVHQIHDEVLILLDESEDTPDTRASINEVMVNAVQMSVPLIVDVKKWGGK